MMRGGRCCTKIGLSIRNKSSISFFCVVLFSTTLLVRAQSGDGQAADLADNGQAALSSGHYAEAQTAFEKLVKLKPAIAEVHATLAVIYFKQREYELAVNEIHTAQRLKPSIAKVDSLLGVSLAELGRFHEAIPGLEKGFKQVSDREVQRMCGLQLLRAYTGVNRDPEAVSTALALIKQFSDDPEVLYNTARILGNYTYLVMERLHDRAPDSIWMMQAQGEAYESQKDFAGAIAAYERVLKVEPGRPGIHYRLGRVYLRRYQDSHDVADREAAIRELSEEMKADPRNGNAAYEMAQINYDTGNLDEARQRFEVLLSQRPDFEQAHVGLAGVLLENQKADAAVPHLKKAISLEPDDEVAWYRLARAYRILGNDQGQKDALAEYQRLRKITLSQRAPRSSKDTQSDELTPQRIEPSAQP